MEAKANIAVLLGTTAAEIILGVPYIDRAIELVKQLSSLRDQIFLDKLEAFLSNFGEISEAEKQRMRSRLENEDERERIGQVLVLTLERAEELEKARLIGKCFRAFLEERILRDDLYRFWHAIDRCLVDDLSSLELYKEKKFDNQHVGLELQSCGFVQITEMRGVPGNDRLANVFIISSLGKKFLEEVITV